MSYLFDSFNWLFIWFVFFYTKKTFRKHKELLFFSTKELALCGLSK